MIHFIVLIGHRIETGYLRDYLGRTACTTRDAREAQVFNEAAAQREVLRVRGQVPSDTRVKALPVFLDEDGHPIPRADC